MPEKKLSLVELAKKQQEEDSKKKQQKQLDQLHPPVAPLPAPIKQEIKKEAKDDLYDPNTSFSLADEKLFEEIAKSTDFKRLVYRIFYGKSHRGTSKDLERQLAKRQEQLNVVSEINLVKEIKRGSKTAFRKVVTELKVILEERRKKIEEGDFNDKK